MDAGEDRLAHGGLYHFQRLAGIDDGPALRLGLRQFKIALPNPLVKFRGVGIQPVPFTPSAALSPQSGVGFDV